MAKSYVGTSPPTGELAPPPRGNPGSATGSVRGIVTKAVADPGFSPRWGYQPSRRAPTYDFLKISQKLHEI